MTMHYFQAHFQLLESTLYDGCGLITPSPQDTPLRDVIHKLKDYIEPDTNILELDGYIPCHMRDEENRIIDLCMDIRDGLDNDWEQREENILRNALIKLAPFVNTGKVIGILDIYYDPIGYVFEKGKIGICDVDMTMGEPRWISQKG